MPVRFPRFQALDYGAAVKSRQDIEYRGMRNEVTGMEVQAQRDVIKNREKANEIRTQMEGMPDQISAMEDQGLFDEAEKLRGSYIDAQFNGIKILEVQREGVNEGNWDQWRYDMIQAGAMTSTMLPENYPGDRWFREKEETAKNKLSVLTRQWSEQGVTFSQDFISDEYGDVNWMGTPYEDAKKNGKGGGKPWQMTSGDTNSIRNAAAQLYGTMWDPETQKYAGLNKLQSQEIASISELAAKIYNTNAGKIPHDVAVARAARQKGIVIEKLRPPGNSDNPLNLTRQ